MAFCEHTCYTENRRYEQVFSLSGEKNFFFYVIVSFLGCFVHVSLCTVYSFVNALL